MPYALKPTLGYFYTITELRTSFTESKVQVTVSTEDISNILGINLCICLGFVNFTKNMNTNINTINIEKKNITEKHVLHEL